MYLTVSVIYIAADTRESSPPSPDTLYAMVCAIADEISISDKKANDEIYSKLHCWNKDFIGLHSKHRNLVVLQIFTTPDIVKTYLTFADSLFSGMLQANKWRFCYKNNNTCQCEFGSL